MTNNETVFFDKISASLETPLYFFGSIQRLDYFSKSSDIDVDIFTFHQKSMMNKMCSLLNVDMTSFKRFVYKPEDSHIVIPGYKLFYRRCKNL